MSNNPSPREDEHDGGDQTPSISISRHHEREPIRRPNSQLINEEEVRGIIADLNQNLNQILAENEDMRSKINTFARQKKETEHQLEIVTEQNKILCDEKKHFQELCVRFESELDQREKELVEEERKRISIFKEKDFEGELTKHKKVVEECFENPTQKETFIELIKDYEKTQQDIIQFSFKFEQIVKHNDQLRQQINEAHQERSALRDCIRCHNKFSPVLNDDNSCLYHSGKVKYYSCRGCGSDEYWSCCNRCSTCLKGCREGKHLCL